MGWFGNFARTAGSVGNDVSNARMANDQLAVQAAKDRLAQIMSQLQIQDIQNRLSEFGQVKPSGVERGPAGELTGIVFNPKTGKYESQPLAPGNAPAEIDKEKFRNQLLQQANDPNASPIEKKVLTGLITSLDSGMTPEKVAEDYNRFLVSRSETGTGPKPELKTEIFGGYKWQYDPEKKISGTRDATGQYVRLGVAKEPGTGSEPGDVDALAYDITAGKATMPTGKFGAAVAKRMKELGIEPPLKKDIPQDIKNFLNAPVPQKPTSAESQRLAAAADRVFGGSDYRQDLIARGRRSTLMGLRSSYSPQAYTQQEYADILESIKQSTGITAASNDLPPGLDPSKAKTIK